MSFFGELKRRNVLRVAAAYVVVSWVVVQVAVTLREVFPGTPLWIGQALIALLALGLLPVLAFSWFYELTPDGFRRDQEIGSDRGYAEATGRRLIYLTLVFVFLGIALFAWSGAARSPSLPAGTSIAVLPFANMSADPANEYFSDGLTDTLLHMLAQVNDLKVAARTTTFKYKGQGKDVRDVAAEIGVAHVLEGSVQRNESRVRIIVQLIRAEDGFHVWSQTYDRELVDIFDVQDDIAANVSDSLVASVLQKLSGERPAGLATRSVEAYDLYLRARAEISKYSFESLEAAERMLREALRVDPGFTDAKAELAATIWWQWDIGARPGDEALDAVSSIVEEILAADPKHARAKLTQLRVRITGERSGDFDGWPALLPTVRALVAEYPESTEARLLLADIESRSGAPEEAQQTLEAALDNDRLNIEVLAQLAKIYMDLDDLQSARDAVERIIFIEPDSTVAYDLMARIGRTGGNWTELVQGFLKGIEADPDDPEYPAALVVDLYYLGLPDYGDYFLRQVEAIAPESAAYLYAKLAQHHYYDAEEEGEKLARYIISEQRFDRRYAWQSATSYLLGRCEGRAQCRETVTFVDAHMPGFADLQNTDLPGFVLSVRMQWPDKMALAFSNAEANAMISRTVEYFVARGVPLNGAPKISAGIDAFKGQTDAAIELILADVLSAPSTQQDDWRAYFARPVLADVVADPRVAAQLERLAQEQNQARESVRALLASQIGEPH
ncbi:MAG: hypothetical protein OEW64_03900 [Gammaproteobacteria bacterium]|nr:hypothetical protein [Gammaproteobacteria bacterium]MDH5303220.1 hypothetical protein [Gammaproteobacteria bacterium]MDH5322247.1 hypothetical protein [Gammaproteobacteria bacterium]